MLRRVLLPVALTFLGGLLGACGGGPEGVDHQAGALVTVDPGELETMPDPCEARFGPDVAAWPQVDAVYALGPERTRLLLVRQGAPLCVAPRSLLTAAGAPPAPTGNRAARILSPTGTEDGETADSNPPPAHRSGPGTDDTADSNPLPAHRDGIDLSATADSNPLPAHRDGDTPADSADSNPLPAHREGDAPADSADSNPLPAHLEQDLLRPAGDGAASD